MGSMTFQSDRKNHEFPRQAETIIALTARYYGRQKREGLQRILANARYWVQEETSYDNWDGGQYGHTVHLEVPVAVFEEVAPQTADVEQEICKDLNEFAKIPGEFIAEVIIEVNDDVSLEGWREDTGLLVRPSALSQVSTGDELERIWGSRRHFRVFLSHKARYKESASELRDRLRYYGVTCFVAHEDIEPAKEWVQEIEKALFSMEVMIALLTPEYHESRWTDQEVGIAIGRGVPVISVKLGLDPYGFIGKYQALSGNEKPMANIAGELLDLFLQNSAVTKRAFEALTFAFLRSGSFQQSKDLIAQLEKMQTASPDTIERLQKSLHTNSQVSDAWGVAKRVKRLLKRLKGGNQ